MNTDTAAKKDTQKLQRAVVDGLEDVKAQDIQVFDTEHLSPLFERVVVASGTSNRQTKALAASVRDAVREAGFPKPRIEGEANGEWIIVDCAQVVVHIMQPNFRSYYHLEELWGEKPVRMKFGAAKPLVKVAVKPAAKATGKAAAKAGGKTPARKAAIKKSSARPLMPPDAPMPGPRTPKPRPAARPAPGRAGPAKSAVARPVAARSRKPAASPAAKAPARRPRASKA